MKDLRSLRAPRASAIVASLALVGAGLVSAVPAASAPDVPARPMHSAFSMETTCGTGAIAEPREINLVLDDSGSMFSDGPLGSGTDRQRWSQAKYSLEVFAAMLEPNDTLNVYLLSNSGLGPVETVSGAMDAAVRVQIIHDMQLKGGSTPYQPVQNAYDDLAASEPSQRWLVVVSDGEFDNAAEVIPEGLRDRLIGYAAGASPMKVAYLSLGAQATPLLEDPTQGLFTAHANEGTDLLATMTGFSNRIFERVVLPQSDDASFDTDIVLSEVLVFAQGAGVEVNSLEIVSEQDDSGERVAEQRQPDEIVDVAWADNVEAEYSGTRVPAVPDETLEGQVATFFDVPPGSVSFDITNASTVEVYYKPDVVVGAQVSDGDGNAVPPGDISTGTYTVDYGFMDPKSCEIITSTLLKDPQFTAQVLLDGVLDNDNFANGDSLEFGRGELQLHVAGVFPDGTPVERIIDFQVRQAARPGELQVTAPEYRVSLLNDYGIPDDAILVEYLIRADDVFAPPTAEEWETVLPSSIAVETEAHLDFEAVRGDEPGQILLLPQAPGGDVYAAATGEIPIVVTVEHEYDLAQYSTSAEVVLTVVDDLSLWDRLLHWFTTIGWWILLLALLAILAAGYLFKPRFARKIKKSPEVSGVPMSVGTQSERSTGKFRINPGRRVLPFLADTATLRYVPSGVSGFTPMKLKAARGGKMRLTNWQALAKRKNVAINGSDLNEETTRMPLVGPSSMITATVPKSIRYESYPNT